MAPITVTSSSGGNASLAVKVLTGAAASQPGATTTSTTATAKAITPAASGSLAYAALGVFCSGSGGTQPYTATAASQILADVSGFTVHRQAVALRSLNPTAAGTPVTVGGVSQGVETNIALALAEILAAGTLAEDASSPPPVPADGSTSMGGSTLTTAPFTPPAGSLLVAMACSGATPPAVSDSSGLTWTKQAGITDPGTQVSAAVWTAPVPGTPGLTVHAGLAAAVARALAAAVAGQAAPGWGYATVTGHASTATVTKLYSSVSTVEPLNTSTGGLASKPPPPGPPY
jgi:hypothetical protein